MVILKKIVKLPKIKKKRGCIYEFVKRDRNVAMYSLSYSQGTPKIGFDVFRVTQSTPHPQSTKYDVTGDVRIETFSSDEKYGSSAFSYTTEVAANVKYAELCERYNKHEV